jgi:alcohol dehydrogenase class IV
MFVGQEKGLFSLPTQVYFGNDAVKDTGSLVKKRNIDKVLIATDSGVIKAGLLEGIIASLKESSIEYEVFDEVLPNPTADIVEKGLDILKKTDCRAVLGVGGGSSIDAAKAIAIMATNPGKISDYAGFGLVKNDPMPIIAIPTTAGTGSEVTVFTVITDSRNKFKMSIGGYNVAPTLSIVDPKMTLTVPPAVTASTGVDALTHAIESYLSICAKPYTESIALGAIQLISSSIREAYGNGYNIEAREKMMCGSMMAGMAFTNTKLGIVHAMSNTFGGYYPSSAHGVVNAVLLPYAMEFNMVAAPVKFAKIAEAMGINVRGMETVDAAQKAVENVKKLVKELNIPDSLKIYNVSEDDIPQMAQDSFKVANAKVNCRQVTEEDIIELYKKACM